MLYRFFAQKDVEWLDLMDDLGSEDVVNNKNFEIEDDIDLEEMNDKDFKLK